MPDRQLGDVRALVERLRGMDVEVYQAQEVGHRCRTHASSAAVAHRTSPCRRAPYWIPMDQPQKHWIQALMGEDPYVPFPYFYDVSSWSNPLLMGVDDHLHRRRPRPRRGRPGPGHRWWHRLAAPPLTGSYTYPLDSAAAAEFTFTPAGPGCPLVRRPPTSGPAVPARPVELTRGQAAPRSHWASRSPRARRPASGTRARPARRRAVPGHRHLHHLRLARRGPLRAGQAVGPRPHTGHHGRHQRQHRGVHRPDGAAGAGRQQRHRRARPRPGRPTCAPGSPRATPTSGCATRAPGWPAPPGSPPPRRSPSRPATR